MVGICANNSRVKTSAVGESECQHENKEVKHQKSLHKFSDSLLSSQPNYNLFRGLLNQFPILLILSSSYITLEYLAKYGVLIYLIELVQTCLVEIIRIPTLSYISGLNLMCLFSFGFEVFLSKGLLTENFGLLLIIILLTLQISIAPIVAYFMHSLVVSACLVSGNLTVFMKLISYHVENYRCRKEAFTAAKSEIKTISMSQMKEKGIPHEHSEMVQYPDNLTVQNLYHFLFAPTFCYELNFPRRPNIRMKFLITRLFELLLLVAFDFSMMHQVLVPLSLEYQQAVGYVNFALISIKCFISMIFIVLVMHYTFFHTWLNIWGEVTQFGDRCFYEDWWNSGNMKEYWRTWNIPVHRWALRYLYKPLLNRGFSKLQAICGVFLVSAFFHEYFFSITLKTLQMKFFLVMLTQIPLVHYSSNQPTIRAGSVVVWIFTHFSGTQLTSYFIGAAAPPALRSRIFYD